MNKLKYKVATLRAAGLEAKWIKMHACPILAARDPAKGGSFYAVDRKMWKAMEEEGIKPAFDRFTLLGDIFSIPA